MLSTWNKIERVTGLKDGDLTEFERGFVKTLRAAQSLATAQVVKLSDKQLAVLDNLYEKHFAG